MRSLKSIEADVQLLTAFLPPLDMVALDPRSLAARGTRLRITAVGSLAPFGAAMTFFGHDCDPRRVDEHSG